MIKDKLMNALKVAAADYNSGTSANTAVAKAAEDADFNEKQAERLVEMFNTLATLNKEKDAIDPAGSCELAEKDAVAKILIDSCGKCKTASSQDQNVSEYEFYNTSPDKTNSIMEARISGRNMLMKAASATEENEPEEMRVSERSLYKIIRTKIDQIKSASIAADDVVRNLNLSIEEDVIKIAKSIESPFASDDIADLFKVACESPKALERISEYSTKVANSNGGRFASAAVYDTTPVDDLLKIAEEIEKNINLIPRYEKARDFYQTKAAEAQNDLFGAVGINVKPDKPQGLADFFHGVYKCEKDASTDCQDTDEVVDVGISTKIASLLRETGVSADEVERLAADFEKVSSPVVWSVPTKNPLGEAHSALIKEPGIDDEKKRLLNVRRSILLADLMANDPIIRDADPNTVGEAYKTMIMDAPRVSLDKAEVRSFLRTAVNSVAISPSDAKIITDVDKGISISNVDRLTARDSSVKDSNL